MEKRELNVEIRNELGKSGSRKLRLKDQIPAVFYGPHLDKPVSLSLNAKELTTLRQKGTNALLTLKTSSDSPVSGKVVLIKELQTHPLTGKALHVDFYEVRMDEEIKVNVPIILIGKAAGVAEGGILQQVSRELEVKCLPNAVPNKITVDVSNLNVGDSIHVQDIQFPAGVKFVGQVNYTIAAVVMPEEEVVAAPVAAPIEGAAEVPGAAAPGAAAPAAGAPAPEGEKGKSAAPAKEGEKKAEGKKADAKKSEGK